MIFPAEKRLLTFERYGFGPTYEPIKFAFPPVTNTSYIPVVLLLLIIIIIIITSKLLLFKNGHVI